MTNFAQDNFPAANGTDLSGRTDTLGNTWSGYIIGSAIHETGANSIVETASANGMLSNSGTPPSADYTVQCDTTAGTSSASQSAGPMARVNNVSGGNGYLALVNQTSAVLQVYKLVNGSFTQLGSNASLPGGTATLSAVQIQVAGTSIKLNVNGVNQISQTDSAISAAGLSGVLLNGDGGTATKLSNFSAFGAGGGFTAKSRRTLSARVGSRQPA